MTKFSRSLFAALVIVTMTASLALAAGSAHYIKNATSGAGSGATFTVNFKEAGLASGQLYHYVLSATGTAVYRCQNNGSNFPQADNKVGPSTISAPGTFEADKGGNIVGTLTLLAPPSTLSCPGNQKPVLVSADFTNITLTNIDNGDTRTFGDYHYKNPLFV